MGETQGGAGIPLPTAALLRGDGFRQVYDGAHGVTRPTQRFWALIKPSLTSNHTYPPNHGFQKGSPPPPSKAHNPARLNEDSFPRISVVLANYNHAHYLPRCLQGMLEQPVLPYEIIAIDDCSKDNSMEVLQEYAKKHPVLKVFKNEKNLGVWGTQNRGIQLATGDYIVFPAADDELKPRIFELAVKMLKQYPQAGVFTGVCEWRTTDTNLSWLCGARMPKEACYLSPEDMIKLGRHDRLVISGQNAAYKRSALIEAGCWHQELPWVADWFGSNVLGFRYGICHVPDVLSVFNLHPTSYFNSAKSQGERRDVMRRVLRLLESEKFRDVAPLINRSGMIGGLGGNMVQVVLGSPKNWKYISYGFLRQAGQRIAEKVGRRFIPKSLARVILKTFYGKG